MCGSSGLEKGISAEQGKFFTELMQSYNTEFAGQQAILSSLSQAFQPIIAAGPNQQGFGAQELAALNTQIAQGTGQNYAKAAQALHVAEGARGGGNEMLPSGSTRQLDEMLASQAAQTMSNQQLGVQLQNYQQGRQNFFNAAGALTGAAGLYNPSAAAGQATGAGGQAFGSAEAMFQQGN